MPSIGVNVGIALAGRALGVRLDPYNAFNFLVEIEGIIAGGFSEVSGLEISTEVEKFREGGVNDREIILPKFSTQSNLLLKKGQTDLDLLWNWYADVVAGKVSRKNGSIYLLDAQGLPAMWWDFLAAGLLSPWWTSVRVSNATVLPEALKVGPAHLIGYASIKSHHIAGSPCASRR